MVARYFRIEEIDRDDFVHETGGDLDCSQLIVPVGGSVYAALDEGSEDELEVSLDSFSEEVCDDMEKAT